MDLNRKDARGTQLQILEPSVQAALALAMMKALLAWMNARLFVMTIISQNMTIFTIVDMLKRSLLVYVLVFCLASLELRIQRMLENQTLQRS